MTDKYSEMLRDRKCLSCGHEWTMPVKLSVYTANLSGEARVWCPQCGGGTIVSYPARLASEPVDVIVRTMKAKWRADNER